MKRTDRYCDPWANPGRGALFLLACLWLGCGPAERSELEHLQQVAQGLGLTPLAGSTENGSRWSSLPPMHSMRYEHTATLLPNGKVLIAGGSTTGGDSATGSILKTAELYDLDTGKWRTTGELRHARRGHTATLLPNGKVLVTGGVSPIGSGTSDTGTADKALASCEVYDPVTETWSEVTGMGHARFGHTATLLPAYGKVLITGGSADLSGSTARPRGSSALQHVEVYDPEQGLQGTWSPAARMYHARFGHTATLLPAGKVLVAGGAAEREAEEYDPVRNTWEPVGSLLTNRLLHTATLLPTGKVLVAGGTSEGGRVLGTAEVYDPQQRTWSDSKLLMRQARFSHTATLLPGGKVLVAGGRARAFRGLPGVELYDPEDGSWRPGRPLRSGSFQHTATLLPGGKVLVTGGVSSTPLNRAEVYDPGPGSWREEVAMPAPRSGHTVTLLPNGQVLVVGGTLGRSSSLTRAMLYDPASGQWNDTGALGTARSHHTATLLPTGQVLVAGGRADIGNPLNSAELYDPLSGTWSPTRQPLGTARSHHTATLLPNGQVLLAGGTGGADKPLDSAELYDPATGAWTSTAPLGTARTGHTATLLLTDQVLLAGGTGGADKPLDSAELYDLATGAWTSTAPLGTARSHHTATLLASGQVLLAGGRSGDNPLRSAELYDPQGRAWSLRSELLATARAGHTATLLPTGQVLLVGGRHEPSVGALASAEVYDPALGACSPALPLSTARSNHTATLLPTGQVLVIGGLGSDQQPLGKTQVYSGLMSLADEAARPSVNPLPSRRPEGTLELTGSRLLGVASSPLLSLTAVEGGALTRVSQWRQASDTQLTLTLPRVRTGYYVLSVMPQGTSGGQFLFVDDTRPTAPEVLTPAPNMEFFTTNRPRFAGTAEPHSLVTVTLGEAPPAQVQADFSGAWSYTPTEPLARGSYTATVSATDEAGNQSDDTPVTFHLASQRSRYGWSCASAPALPTGGAWWVGLAALARLLSRRRPCL